MRNNGLRKSGRDGAVLLRREVKGTMRKAKQWVDMETAGGLGLRVGCCSSN